MTDAAGTLVPPDDLLDRPFVLLAYFEIDGSHANNGWSIEVHTPEQGRGVMHELATRMFIDEPWRLDRGEWMISQDKRWYVVDTVTTTDPRHPQIISLMATARLDGFDYGDDLADDLSQAFDALFDALPQPLTPTDHPLNNPTYRRP